MNLKNIIKIYNKEKEKIIVLNNISYEFEKGKFYLITGHSGCGKTTLIQIMGLMLPPTKGQIYIKGKNISTLNNSEKALIRKETIGFVFQTFYLNEKLTAKDNIILPMLINETIPKKDRNEKALSLLKQVNLTKRANHYPEELSGGEQQRVAIARALANNPDIILADEPTGNLDIKTEKEILKTLKDITLKGKTIIMVSHSQIAATYADKVLELSNGKLKEVFYENN